jgi:hypothetical protein
MKLNFKLLALTLLMFHFLLHQSLATIYTFHTDGDYTNVSNWDVYPGTELITNDTISIEANCTNINLVASDGYVVFEESSNSIEISTLQIDNNCQLEIKATNFQMQITGSFDYNIITPIITTPNTFLDIINLNFGITNNFCSIFDNNIFVFYDNIGIQDGFLLNCMEGQFINSGQIDVYGPDLSLSCDLDLSNGVVQGAGSFDIYLMGGSLEQNCSNCTATINNVITINISTYAYILGTVIINPPE